MRGFGLCLHPLIVAVTIAPTCRFSTSSGAGTGTCGPRCCALAVEVVLHVVSTTVAFAAALVLGVVVHVVSSSDAAVGVGTALVVFGPSIGAFDQPTSEGTGT